MANNVNNLKPSSGDESTAFTQEWTILHNDHEKYERYSLLIKLVSVLVSFLALAFDLNLIISVIFIAVIWLQDGIWKTFQARMSDRILLVEQLIKKQLKEGAAGNNEDVHFQFYSDWDKSPKGIGNLLKEYMKNAIRPTVAYPYAVLIFIQVVVFIL